MHQTFLSHIQGNNLQTAKKHKMKTRKKNINKKRCNKTTLLFQINSTNILLVNQKLISLKLIPSQY